MFFFSRIDRDFFFYDEILFKIQKCFSWSMNMGHIKKNDIFKMIFYFLFCNGISKFGANWPTSYRDTKFLWKRCSILYNTDLLKNSGSKIILIFDFISGYQILCNSFDFAKSCKCACSIFEKLQEFPFMAPVSGSIINTYIFNSIYSVYFSIYSVYSV